MSRLSDVIDRLAATIEARRGADAGGSYTAQLLKDPARAAKKLGEEAVEAVLAAASEDRERVIAESADLIYHLLVVLHARGIALAEVEAALAARQAQSGLQEKASRKND